VSGVQRAGKWVLVAGRDRLAACHVAGLLAVPVRVVDDATPADLRRLELAENIFRRPVHDRAKQLAEYFNGRVAEVLAEKQAEATALPAVERVESLRGPAPLALTPTGPGAMAQPDAAGRVGEGISPHRNATTFVASPLGLAKAQVREELAAAGGRSPEAIRKTVDRELAKSAPPAPPRPGSLRALELAKLGRLARRCQSTALALGDAPLIEAADALMAAARSAAGGR